MQQATSTTAQAPPESSRSRVIVVLGCFFALVIFLSTTALLCWHWIRHRNADAMIIVQGHEEIAGATVDVKPLDSSIPAPPQTELTERDHYRARIHVEPGPYFLRITRGQNLLLNREVDADPLYPFFVEMNPPTTQPQTAHP
jgi:hypothetical protein